MLPRTSSTRPHPKVMPLRNFCKIQFNDLCFSPDGDVYVTESIGSSVQEVMGSDAARALQAR